MSSSLGCGRAGGGSSAGIRTAGILEARAGWDQTSHRHVLLQAAQVVEAGPARRRRRFGEMDLITVSPLPRVGSGVSVSAIDRCFDEIVDLAAVERGRRFESD